MPVTVKKRGGKYRVLEGNRIAKTKLGNPVDGGGHVSAKKAWAQAGHINDAVKRKE